MLAPMKGPVVELRAVGRWFGDCVAVREASFTLEPGKIHAIVGENGAGKSTVMKLAAGVFPPSKGEVRVDGSGLTPATPAEAARRGVGMVHQHFMLASAFTALENLILGAEPTRGGGMLDFSAARRRAAAIMKDTGLEVPLDASTDRLTVGERQRLEILRVLYRGARAILLDEPTAVLSPLEAGELYATLRRLADDGATVAVVTHRLDEVARHADAITVMRRGKVELSRAAAPALSSDELTRAIMGGEAPPEFAPPTIGEDAGPCLEIEGLTLADSEGRRSLDAVSLTVRGGEIVGVAGVEGNGQRELVRALAGLEPRASGKVRVGGADLAGKGVRARRESLGVVHEDRHAEGLLLEATVADNLVLGDLGEDEAGTIARRIERFDVRPTDPARLAGELSGGNQQKIVIARALERVAAKKKCAAAILAQPTRGVDVGAAAVIHRAIGEAAASGMAVLVISADLSELRRLSHRIVVMRRGAIVAELPRDASETEIGRAMLGVEEAG